MPELRSGALLFEGVAEYRNGAISARGRAQARQVSILTPAFPLLRLDATTSYAMEKNRINFTNLLVSMWGGAAQGTLEANFENSPAKFRLNAHLHQVQLDNVLRSASAAIVPAEQMHPSAAASGALNATWSGQWQGLKADFDLSLQPPAAAPHLLPISGTARGTLEDGRGLTVHLDDSEFRTPHSSISARGTLSEKLQSSAPAEPLALSVSTDDFEEWRPFFQSLAAAPSGIPLELKSRAEFSGRLSGTYEEPSLAGRVAVGQFVYRGGRWDRLTAGVTLNPGFIEISNGHIEREKSSFELNASAQLNHWRVGPSSMIRFSAHAQRTPTEGLSAVMNSEVPIRGFLTGRVDVEGTTATLAGSGSVRIDAGALADEPFDSFSTQVRVQHSVWKLQNIQMRKNRGRMTGDITLEPGRRFASGQLEGSDFHLSDMRRLPVTTSPGRPEGRLAGVFKLPGARPGNSGGLAPARFMAARQVECRGNTLGRVPRHANRRRKATETRGGKPRRGWERAVLARRPRRKVIGRWRQRANFPACAPILGLARSLIIISVPPSP